MSKYLQHIITKSFSDSVGLSAQDGQPINVGSPLTPSNINAYGTANFFGSGNTATDMSSIYVLPGSTAMSGSGNYFYTYFATPVTTGTTTGSAYTLYIQGAPLGATNPYALYVNGGASYFGGQLTASGDIGSLTHTIRGSISGAITIAGQAASGTYNFNLPITAGTAGQFLTSGGGLGNPMTWSAPTVSFNSPGSTTPANASLYVNPASTSVSGASNYFYTYLTAPVTTGTTTGSAYTMYIEGSPTGTITNPYSLYVNSGVSYFGGSVNINTLTHSQSVMTDVNKNLISVANTGTGNNVLSLSPNITNPTITPFSTPTIYTNESIVNGNDGYWTALTDNFLGSGFQWGPELDEFNIKEKLGIDNISGMEQTIDFQIYGNARNFNKLTGQTLSIFVADSLGASISIIFSLTIDAWNDVIDPISPPIITFDSGILTVTIPEGGSIQATDGNPDGNSFIRFNTATIVIEKTDTIGLNCINTDTNTVDHLFGNNITDIKNYGKLTTDYVGNASNSNYIELSQGLSKIRLTSGGDINIDGKVDTSGYLSVGANNISLPGLMGTRNVSILSLNPITGFTYNFFGYDLSPGNYGRIIYNYVGDNNSNNSMEIGIFNSYLGFRRLGSWDLIAQDFSIPCNMQGDVTHYGNFTVSDEAGGGLITGSNGLTITSGTSALQAITGTTIVTSGLATAGGGLTIGTSVGATVLTFADVAGNAWQNITSGSGGNGSLTWGSGTVGSFTSRMQLSSSGTLTVTGDVSSFGTISDRRLKSNILNLDSLESLNIIRGLRPVSFDWNKDLFNKEYAGTPDSGFIAQEIQELIPHAVGEFRDITDNTIYMNMRHERIIPYLVSVVQNLLYRIEVLEKNKFGNK